MKDDQKNQRSEQGTGSSEHTGKTREEQMNQNTETENGERQEISLEGGLGRNNITDIGEMGGMSGRDDYAGGDNDGMSDQNSGQETER